MKQDNPVATGRAALRVPRQVAAIIDGVPQWGGEVLSVLDPYTGESIAELHESSAATVAAAVASAERAFRTGPWPQLPVEERQQVLRRVADLIDRDAAALAALECLNTGIPLRQLEVGQIRRSAYNFRFFADYLGQAAGEAWFQTPGVTTYVRRRPAGVAALIGPWNAPLALTSMKVAAALAFGNTCVVKPSEQTPLTAWRLCELLQEAGVPAGAVNLVQGRGATTGAALVEDPRIARVSFTGGTATGRRVMAAAAQSLVPATMELGGKSANLVFADADLEQALDAALLSIYSNNGQQCLAGARLLVERRIAGDFLAAFAERAARLQLGDPFAAATDLGPVGSLLHRDRIQTQVRGALAEGCQLLVGGPEAVVPSRGSFVAPTALQAPSMSLPICQEEVFGPVATVMTFDTVDEACQLAADSRFGLVAYAWTRNVDTLSRLENELRVGTLWQNLTVTRELRAPFGGYGESGTGREGGRACEAFYTEETTISRATGPRPPLRRLGLR
jgi:acyl-CoA reductase-like NAD-dependent aldehyde dehydrogenase